MELSRRDIDVLHEFFGRQRLRKATIRASFARGMLSLTPDVDMTIELNYPRDFGPTLASIKFGIKGILKLRIDVETINGVRKCLSIFMNSNRVLIFEE